MRKRSWGVSERRGQVSDLVLLKFRPDLQKRIPDPRAPILARDDLGVSSGASLKRNIVVRQLRPHLAAAHWIIRRG